MPILVGALAFVLVLLFGLATSDRPIAWIGIAFIAGIIAFAGARELRWFDDEAREQGLDLSSTAPPFVAHEDESIDLGDELLDLLRSASVRANRLLEDTGRLDPFVIYEDQQGNVRVRSVDQSDPERTVERGRIAARSVDPGAPRLVLVWPGVAEFGGRRRSAVIYEAAERRFRDRTLVFVQRRTSRRLVFPAGTAGLPEYAGDAGHSLRFSRALAPDDS